MKAIHGGKTKNDRLDSEKIAILLRGGMLPEAYAYPRAMRPTRDLLRRRARLVRMRSELLGHVQLSKYQYNLDPFKKRSLTAPGVRASPSTSMDLLCAETSRST